MNGAAGTFVALLPVSVAFSSSAAVLLDDEASNSSFTIVVLLDSATASCFSMFLYHLQKILLSHYYYS